MWAKSTGLERAQTNFIRTKGDGRRETEEARGHTDWWQFPGPQSRRDVPIHTYTLFMSREEFFWK